MKNSNTHDADDTQSHRVEPGKAHEMHCLKTNRPVVPRIPDEIDGDSMSTSQTGTHQCAKTRNRECHTRPNQGCTGQMHPQSTKQQEPKSFFHTRSNQSRPIPTPKRCKSKPPPQLNREEEARGKTEMRKEEGELVLTADGARSNHGA